MSRWRMVTPPRRRRSARMASGHACGLLGGGVITCLMAVALVFAVHGQELLSGERADPETSPQPGPGASPSTLFDEGRVPTGPASASSPVQGPGRLLGGGESEFLHPDVAFVLSAEFKNDDTVVLRWDIAEGYYLYRDKFRFAITSPAGTSISRVALPRGQAKTDEFFGRTEVFYREVEARLSLSQSDTGPAELQLEVTYQGCAEAGLCYPPIIRSLPLPLPPSE